MAPPASYHAILLKIVGHLDGVVYLKGVVISRERLETITPADLMRYFNKITFDDEDPDDDTSPTVRSSLLEFYKKALSFYMPNRMMVWNEISNCGNPTRCTLINDMIKRVKKMEVRKQGVPSRARRPMTHEVYKATLVKLKEYQRNNENMLMNLI